MRRLDVALAPAKANSAKALSPLRCVPSAHNKNNRGQRIACIEGLIGAPVAALRESLYGRFVDGAVRITRRNDFVAPITDRSRAGDPGGAAANRGTRRREPAHSIFRREWASPVAPWERQRVDPTQGFGGLSPWPTNRPLRVGEKRVSRRSRTLARDSTSSVVFSLRPTRCRGVGFRASADQRCAWASPRQATGWDSE
jgi:hypothetical protein